MTGDLFSVLFVCHANLCRSPMAERLARLVIAGRLGPNGSAFTVGSAGTHAYPGDPMHRHAARVLREYGADDTGFTSLTLVEPLMRRADLVLTATREQRAHCVAVTPAAVRRTFTLRQFARLVGAVDPVRLPPAATPIPRLHALIDETIVVRSRFQSVPPHEDDLADPVNQPVDAFRTCAREIWGLLDAITSPIAGLANIGQRHLKL